MKFKIFLYARLQTFQTRMESSFAGRALASAAGGLKTRMRSLACRLNDWRPGQFFPRRPTRESLRADRIKMSCLMAFYAGFFIWAEIALRDLFIPGGWTLIAAAMPALYLMTVLFSKTAHQSVWPGDSRGSRA